MRVLGDERGDVELALGVEAEMALRDLLPEQAVGADRSGLLLNEAGTGRAVANEKMVADLIEDIDVAARKARQHVRHGRHFLEEHFVAQLLRPLHVLGLAGQLELKIADTAERIGQLKHGVALLLDEIRRNLNVVLGGRNENGGCAHKSLRSYSVDVCVTVDLSHAASGTRSTSVR